VVKVAVCVILVSDPAVVVQHCGQGIHRAGGLASHVRQRVQCVVERAAVVGLQVVDQSRKLLFLAVRQ
jgi:hypothetical protein